MGQEIKINCISSVIKTQDADQYILNYQFNDDIYVITGMLLGNFTEENLDFSEDLNKVDFFELIDFNRRPKNNRIKSKASKRVSYDFNYESAPMDPNENFMVLGWLGVYKSIIRTSSIHLNLKFQEILKEDEKVELAEFPREEFEMAMQKYSLG